MERKRWIAALVTGVLMGCTPWILHLIGLWPEVRPIGWLAIILLFLLAGLKIAYAPSLSNEGFTYAKQGNDFCLITMSGAPTAFITQWAASDKDLLPGARHLLDFISLGQSPITMNIIGVACVGAIGLLGYLLTASQISKTRTTYSVDNTLAKPLTSVRGIFCYIIGLFCLTCNIAILISK